LLEVTRDLFIERSLRLGMHWLAALITRSNFS